MQTEIVQGKKSLLEEILIYSSGVAAGGGLLLLGNFNQTLADETALGCAIGVFLGANFYVMPDMASAHKKGLAWREHQRERDTEIPIVESLLGCAIGAFAGNYFLGANAAIAAGAAGFAIPLGFRYCNNLAGDMIAKTLIVAPFMYGLLRILS